MGDRYDRRDRGGDRDGGYRGGGDRDGGYRGGGDRGGGDRDGGYRGGGGGRGGGGDRNDGRGEFRRPPRNMETMHSLRVGNLPFSAVAEDLIPLFEKYGDVGDVYFPRERDSGRSRGFAFVRFHEKHDAEDAMEALNGRTYDGRDLKISMDAGRPHQPRNDRQRSRSRSGGRGGGSRRRSPSRSRSRDRKRRSPSRSRSRDRKRRSSSGGKDKKSASRSRSKS